MILRFEQCPTRIKNEILSLAGEDFRFHHFAQCGVCATSTLVDDFYSKGESARAHALAWKLFDLAEEVGEEEPFIPTDEWEEAIV